MSGHMSKKEKKWRNKIIVLTKRINRHIEFLNSPQGLDSNRLLDRFFSIAQIVILQAEVDSTEAEIQALHDLL